MEIQLGNFDKNFKNTFMVPTSNSRTQKKNWRRYRLWRLRHRKWRATEGQFSGAVTLRCANNELCSIHGWNTQTRTSQTCPRPLSDSIDLSHWKGSARTKVHIQHTFWAGNDTPSWCYSKDFRTIHNRLNGNLNLLK